MSLSPAQVAALLKPINPSRVLKDNKGLAHVSQQDIRAHLTRVFGFGGWSSAITDLTMVREAHAEKAGKETTGWAVTYRATVRLEIRDPQGQPVASFEDVATGTSPNLPTLGDAHDFACKVAVSMALKRAATNLGDGYGLSLYNKGQLKPLVIATLVMPDGEGKDASDEVPEQVSMGHDDAGSAESTEAQTATQTPRTPDREAKAALWTFAQAHGFSTVPALAEAFAEFTGGLVLGDANAEECNAFLMHLRSKENAA